MISVGTLAIFNGYLPGKKHNDRLPKKIEDIFKEINPKGVIDGKNYITLDIGAALIECGTDAAMPKVKYIFA